MGQLVPPLILDNFINGNYQGEFPAVGFCVDISGSSTMTDALMLHGKHGSEVLARIMSEVFDPLGKNLCSGTDCEEMIVCEFNPENTFTVRKKFPFLNDMRLLDVDLGK